jgi:hypothetical protein
MSKIHVGVLQPGARSINLGLTGAVRGVAMFNGIPTGVIAKHGTLEELAVECFCSIVARELHLDAPECGIVHDGKTWMFASVDVGKPNLTQILNPSGSSLTPSFFTQLAKELVTWPKMSRLLAFDVLIRNADRNTGNLLTDGTDWWLIDHARSMELFVYTNHVLFQLVKQVCDATTVSAILARTEGQALTFAVGCHIFAETELKNDVRLASFSSSLGKQISVRLPTLATSIRGAL